MRSFNAFSSSGLRFGFSGVYLSFWRYCLSRLRSSSSSIDSRSGRGSHSEWFLKVFPAVVVCGPKYSASFSRLWYFWRSVARSWRMFADIVFVGMKDKPLFNSVCCCAVSWECVERFITKLFVWVWVHCFGPGLILKNPSNASTCSVLYLVTSGCYPVVFWIYLCWVWGWYYSRTLSINSIGRCFVEFVGEGSHCS